MPRWIQPDEIAELQDRCKQLLMRFGMSYEGEPGQKLAEAWLNNVSIVYHIDGRVVVADGVANVMSFDYADGGVQEVYGGTAYRVLERLRKGMVLDDVADGRSYAGT